MGMLGSTCLQVANMEEMDVSLIYRAYSDLHELQHIGLPLCCQASFRTLRYLPASSARWTDDLSSILQLRL
jgi:hypothetical protein